MGSEREELAPEDLETLDRVAGRVVELHMEVPALLAIETGKPLSLLASQAMLFFEPIVQSLLPVTLYRRFALLVERRAALEALAVAIETRAETARAERRAGRPPAKAGPGPARPGR